MFAAGHTRLTVLTRTAEICINTNQAVINRLRRIRYTAVDVSCNLMPTTHDCCCGYLLGPTPHWQAFVRDEYALAVPSGGAIAAVQPALGDYLRFYLSRIRERGRLLNVYGCFMDYVTFHRQLYRTFLPQAELQLQQAVVMTACPALSGGHVPALQRCGPG